MFLHEGLVLKGKLVRDKIPDLIIARGAVPSYFVLDDGTYKQELLKKLQEEVQEFYASELPEELADILEVVYAIAKSEGLSEDDLNKIRLDKREERGGFDFHIFLNL